MAIADSKPQVFLIGLDVPTSDSVSGLLESKGFRLRVFGSAEEFFEAERPDAPCCLVVDAGLAGMKALDFQDRLERADIDMLLIFLTAQSDTPVALRAMKSGAVALLTKPLQENDLLAAIEQALARDRSGREARGHSSAPQPQPENQPPKGRDAAFDIALLNKIASRLSAADAFHQVLSEVVEFVAAVVECDSCFVYLVEDGDLVLQASKNPHPEAIGRLKMRVGQGITGWVAEHRSPVAAGERAFEDPRFKLFNELPEDRFEAFLSVPLVSGGRLVGVINVQSRAPHHYTQHEIGLVSAVGFLVGAEVERARLESENSELSERLETRKLVERAKGILQREMKISETEAYRILQRESQQRRKSMKDISESILLNEDLKRASKA